MQSTLFLRMLILMPFRFLSLFKSILHKTH